MIPLSALLKLKYPDIILGAFEGTQLSDTGNGPFINIWDYPNAPKPTDADLAEWQTTYDLAYRQSLVMEIRKAQYPSWQQQLDMQYNDAINGTNTWQAAVEAVKTANPIPTV